MSSSRGRRLRTAAIVLVAVAAVGLAVAIVSAPSVYEVEEKGRDLLPYDSGEVYRVRLFDAVTFYADGESRPTPDLVSGMALVAAAVAALVVGLLLRAIYGRRRRHLFAFYAVLSGGMAFLALDELMGIHETVGHNLRFLGDLPAVRHPDDVIVALYALPAMAFLFHFRDLITRSARVRRLFGAAAVLLVAAVALDAFTATPAEDLVEALAGFAILAGLTLLALEHIREALEENRRAGMTRPGSPSDETDADSSQASAATLPQASEKFPAG